MVRKALVSSCLVFGVSVSATTMCQEQIKNSRCKATTGTSSSLSSFKNGIDFSASFDSLPGVTGRPRCAAVRSRGDKPTQQDAMYVNTAFGKDHPEMVPESTELYAVFDGHGTYGDQVANICVDFLERKLGLAWDKLRDNKNTEVKTSFDNFEKSMGQDDDADKDMEMDDANQLDVFQLNNKTRQIFFDLVFKALETTLYKAMRDGGVWDPNTSGTTATIILYDRESKSVVSAWVGDSPAFLIHQSGKTTNLIRDHGAHPDESGPNGEKDRVEKSNGKIQAPSWTLLTRDDQHRVYSLNMTRSLGDFEGKLPWGMAFMNTFCGCLWFPTLDSYPIKDFGKTIISARPGVQKFPVDNDVVAIVVSSDGLVDNLKFDKADHNGLVGMVGKEVLVRFGKIDSEAEEAKDAGWFLKNKPLNQQLVASGQTSLEDVAKTVVEGRCQAPAELKRKGSTSRCDNTSLILVDIKLSS